MRPYFAELGITRLARQTGLDRVGIPCFASFRPNSRTLAVNQGKGLSDDAAQASAVMEAVEFAIAENPRVPVMYASARSLRARDAEAFQPRTFLPLGMRFDEDARISWIEGRGVLGGASIWVPLAVVQLGSAASDLAGICQTTNGLAAGNNLGEAVFHGLCELIERDANTLWCLSCEADQFDSCIDPADFGAPCIDVCVERITGAGLDVRMFEQTCDTGVPVFMAVVAQFGESQRHFEVSAGYGASPDPVQAAWRALAEAVQSRITTIAAARDDIEPAAFQRPIEDRARRLFQAKASARRPAMDAVADEESRGALTTRMARHLIDLGVGEPIVVDLAGSGLPCKVVRVLCPDLEDMGANSNWRPGRRALKVLTAP